MSYSIETTRKFDKALEKCKKKRAKYGEIF